MRIHQLLPCLLEGDAIGNHVLALKRLLQAWGHSSEIYAQDIAPRLKDEARPLSAYKPSAKSITLYHHAFMSDASTRFLSSPGRRVFVYHNITPDTFFEGYNEDARRLTKEARARLGEFRSVDLALGDSAYNCQELKELGYKNVSEVPILVSFDDFKKTQPALEVLERYKDGWTNFLFVGRIAPNKRQDDVIRAFAHYHHHIDSRSRLLLVGGKNGMERYDDALRALARALGVQDHVVFSGHTRFDELVAYYQVSHIFLSMSEHEGFCVPLLEAMWHGIPILAFKSSAIPGTLGAAGWLLREKNPVIAAHACHLLVKDPVIRARVQATQYARLADFQPAPIASLFRSALESLAGNQPAKQA